MKSAARNPATIAALALLCGAGALAGDAPTDSACRLDDVQQEIVGYSGRRAADLAVFPNPLPPLARDYLRAFEPLLRPGAPLSPYEVEGWNDRKIALKRRVQGDMRKWHPIFALTFIETVLYRNDAQLYGLMSSLEGESGGKAYARLIGDRARRLREAGLLAADAARVAEENVDRESVLLRQGLVEVIERRATGILADSLRTDPVSIRLDVVARVSNILAAVAEQSRYRPIDRRIRGGWGDDALPAAVHGATHVVLAQTEEEWLLRQNRFAQLLDIFVVLQNEAARDRLLLLFDYFDTYDDLLGDFAPEFDRILHLGTVEFVLSSLRTDPAAELGLDVVDQLTRWIIERLALDGRELRRERIVDLLLALREARPDVLETYIVRFYRDFHALYPAGYESVVLHLVGIMVQYAEAGVYERAKKVRQRTPDEARPTHEKVMELLRWYNASIDRVRATLRTVDIDFVDRKQREVLDVIAGYFEHGLTPGGKPLETIDPRFLETLLQLLTRVAHVADPDEIMERVLLPLAKALSAERDLVGTDAYADLERLTTIMQRRARLVPR